MIKRRPQQKKPSFYALFFISLIGLFSLFVVQLPIAQADNAPSVEETVTQAWELAQDSGRYEFRTQVEQTTYPLPKITNAGLRPTVQNLGMEGQINLTAEQLNLTLWGDLSFNPDTGIEIRVADGKTEVRQGQDNWEEADNLTDLFAPGGDPMNFLIGVKNVTIGESRILDLGEATIQGTQYLFDLDGPIFAEHMRLVMQQQLQEQGKLPPGIQLSASDSYKRMIGSGELWLNENGLPIHLSYNLDFPEHGDEERVTAVITNNFFNYNLAQLEQATTPFFQSPITWLNVHMPIQNVTSIFAFSLFFVATLLLIKNHWRTKTFHRVTAVSIILSMLFSPHLQSERVSAFFNQQQELQQTAEAQQAQAKTTAFMAQTSQTTDWQPNVTAESQLLANIPSNFALSVGIDTDGDGISDDDELDIWQTDPNNIDSDGDTLEDGLEAFTIGTAPAFADTDGDQINDNIEIAGFTYNSETWYLDPLSNDSNLDGLSDGGECSRWISGTALYNPAVPCPDTDGDGTPDIFDNDNDGDGVKDKFDTNPNNHGQQTFSGDNQFQWQLDNLETDRTIFLDFQMRPTNAGNLALHGNILDWPTNDTEGQITRYLDTTFADTANLNIRSAATNAANGDIRLTPVMEILVPATDGHFGNLPVLPAYSGSPRPANLPAEDWVDSSRLAPYNISVGDTGDPSDPYRDLLLYVPITTQTDPDTGLPIAFSARLPYFPEQGTVGDPAIVEWGNSHQARLVWLVQMITDQCITEGDDPATCAREDVLQVIHVYDESWMLTGLTASEEHGIDVGIIYEDPASDPSFRTDDQLWATANSLNSTFLRGRDIDINSERDVRLNNLATELPSWHDPASGAYYLGFQPFINQYSDSDQIHQIMMTETVSLLDTVFAGYESQTDPTLLFVRETTNRLMTLDMMTATANSFTGDFDPTAVFPATTADMSWKPYDYVSGEWVNANPETYLQTLEANLSDLVFVEPANASQQEIDAVEGQRLWAQIYYASLYQGIGNLVESGGEIIWQTDATIDESNYEPAWPNTTFTGVAYVSQFFVLSLANALVVTVANQFNIAKFSQSGTTFWSAFKSTFGDNNTATFGRNELFPPGSRNPTGSSFMTHAVDATTALVIIASVVGLGFFAYGYFTGDESALETGTIILNAVTLAVSLSHLAIVSFTLFKLLSLAGPAAASLQGLAAAARYQKFLQGSKAYGAIGFIVAILVTWGMFLYQWLSGDFGGNKISRNFSIATSIASTAIAIALLLIDVVLKIVASAALAAVGTIFVLLLVIVDTILYFAGEKTVTQRLTEVIARATYDVDFILSNFNSPKRLAFDLSDLRLADEELGFTIGNAIYPAFAITNTIHFRKQSNNSEARRSAFSYSVQQTENDQHGGLNGNSMNGDWVIVNGRKLQYTTTITSAFPLNFVTSGINQSLPSLYLSEAYAIPYQGCWAVVGIETNDCDWAYIKGTNHIDVGAELYFDILPTTVSAFAAVTAWGGNSDLPFPDQTDVDNDGLLSQAQGGADPNDNHIDSDGDGVTDLVELAKGTDPLDNDSDDDGLSDGEELSRWYTDPNDPDTDDDGLNDYIEIMEGWLTPTGNGNQLMRVWSNPLYADLDGDRLNDLQEFTFGFHPLVPTDPAAIANLIQMNNMEINEPLAPLMHVDFDEIGDSFFPGVTSFGDAGAYVTCNNATDACPLAGVNGRYHNAIQFDGINDLLQAPPISDLDMHQSDFSVSLWLKSSTPEYMTLFARHNGDATWDGGEEVFYVATNGIFQFYTVGSNPSFGANMDSSTTAVFDGDWHHVMAVWDYDELSGQGTGSIYFDGADVTANSYPFTVTPEDVSDQMITIGDYSAYWEPYQGQMDEFMIIPYALTATQVTDTMLGRIQHNDQIIRPSDPLRYQTTVTNTLLTQGANGFLIGSTEPISPVIPLPEIVLHFDEDERIRHSIPWYNTSSNTWTCVDNGTCPGFDGSDDIFYMPTINVREEGDIASFWDQFNFTFHMRLDSLPPEGEVMLIFDTELEAPGALDVYVDSEGWIWFDVQGTVIHLSNVLATPYGDGVAQKAFYNNRIGQHVAHGMPVYAGGQNLGQTVKFTFDYDQLQDGINEFYNVSFLYVDYDDNPAQMHLLYYDFLGGSGEDGLRFGPGTVGNPASPTPFTSIVSPTVGLDGRLNALAAYNGYAGTATFLDHMHNGRWRGYSYNPTLYPSTVIATGDWRRLKITYPNDVDNIPLASCGPFDNIVNANYCPDTDPAGVAGEAVLFGGEDDLAVGSVNFPQDDYTISVWFKTNHNSEQYILGALDPDNGDSVGLALGLTTAGAVTFDHNFPTTSAVTVTTQSATGYNDGTWHHVAIVREETQNTLYLDGVMVDTASGGNPANVTPNLILGRLKTYGSLMYNGSLDELVILPVALAEDALDMLRTSTWPAIQIDDTFVPFHVDAASSTTVSGTASVGALTPNSNHLFEQEVEVALELQAPINIPIIDPASANLQIFAPFEDVPGSTTFENLAGTDEFLCPILDACPTAGLRGLGDRSVLFDGVDDYLVNNSGQMLSFATWVKADQGTIFDTRQGSAFTGVRLDFGELRLQVPNGGSPITNASPDDPTGTSGLKTVNLDLPAGEWTHIVVTVNKVTGVATIYIDGVLFGTLNFDPNYVPYTGRPTLGGNLKGGSYLNGSLADFRAYDSVLTPAQVTTLYENNAPRLRLEFDETAEDLFFSDISQNGFIGYPTISSSFNTTLNQTVTSLNPTPGTDGKIGNTALFVEGTGLTLDPIDDSPLDLNEMTIMFWVNPEGESATAQNLLIKNSTGTAERNYQISLQPNSLNLSFGAHRSDCVTGLGDLTSLSELPTNLWTHVAVTFDGNSAEIYFNGILDNSQTYPNLSLCHNDHPLHIGDNFAGELDELALYGRSMAVDELYSIYLRELRWYRTRSSHLLRVDNDTPTVELASTYLYRPLGYTQLVVNTSDPSSSIALLDFGLKAPGDSGFSWHGAAQCEESETGAAWCPSFDSTALAGEGIYEVQFRTVDAVGHETMSPVYQIIVDDTPPVVGSGYSGDLIPSVPTSNVDLSWTITLSGTINEPLVAGLSGSGTNADSILVSLVDRRGEILDGSAQLATLSGGNSWQVGYVTAGTAPSGYYTVTVGVTDEVGNAAETAVGIIRLDAQPTQAESDLWQLPTSGVISQTVTLSGMVSELPTWGGVLATYHFEESAPNTIFHDSSPAGEHGTCSNCPTIVPSPLGQGLAFDGVNDSIDVPTLLNPLTDTFSISLWFNADSAGSGARTLVQQDDGGGQGRTLLWLTNANQLSSSLGASPTFGPVVSTDVWHHVVLSYDGTMVMIYLDGQLAISAPLTAEAADGDLQLGSNRGSTEFFRGMMDEVTFYSSALSDYAIYTLAQDSGYDLGNVNIGFELVDFSTLILPTTSWYTPTLANPTQQVSTWTLTHNELLENYYTIKLRSDDAGGNQSSAGTIWRGLIDRIAPQIVASGQHLGGGSAAQTEYTFTFSDFLLDIDGFVQPCDEAALIHSTYNDSVLPHDGKSYQVTATCRVLGHETSRTFTTCDSVGHCTDETVNLTPSPAVGSIAILTPTAHVPITGTVVTVPIGGGAYATDDVRDIAILVDGVPLADFTYGSGVTDTLWSTTAWQPAENGVYTITAVMTDSFGTVYTDNVQIPINIRVCIADYNADGVTDFASIGMRAVQEAVDAATSGSTIRLAGTCTGVQTKNSLTQTVYISKSLTIEGGYNIDESWILAAASNTTVLDAGGSGRVIYVNAPSGNVVLKHLTLTGGHSLQTGGGVHHQQGELTLNNVIVVNNLAENEGGGLYQNNGTVTISNTLVVSNTSNGWGGGIYKDAGILTISGSSVSYNTATGSNSGGGLILNRGISLIENSLLTGNQASDGGAIKALNDTGSEEQVTIVNSTISDNSAGFVGGIQSFADNLTLSYTTVVSNTNSGVYAPVGNRDANGSLFAYNGIKDCANPFPTDPGYNLDSDNSCGFSAGTSLPNTNPLLAPLANNGGNTFTHEPLAGSPVIDVIMSGDNGCGTTIMRDQRGATRPFGSDCDMGAHEVIYYTLTWNGSADNNWANSANWTPNQVPSIGVSALIPVGPTIWPQINGTAHAFDLTIEAGAALTIMDGGSLHVEGEMVNNGSFTQTIATVPAAGSRFLHIQNQAGTVDKYLGVDITPQTGMTGVTVAIRGHQECTNVTGETVQRCFEIDVTGSDTATIIFHYRESERNSLMASNIAAYHWSGTQPWTVAGTVGSRDHAGTAYSVTVIGVSDYSPFVLAENIPTAVPVFIPTLQATLSQDGNKVQLSWDDESNNCSYNIHADSSPTFTPDGTNILVALGPGITSYSVPIGSSNEFYIVQPNNCSSGATTGMSGTVGVFLFSIVAGT